MGDKNRIKEEFDNFKSAYHNLEAMTEGMSEEELELIHKIQVVLKDHEDVIEEAAVNIIAEEAFSEETGETGVAGVEDVSDVVTEHETEVELESELEPESETDSALEPESELELEPETDSALESESEPESESEMAADPEPAEKPLPVPPVGDRKPDFFDKVEAAFCKWNPKGKLGLWIRKDRHNAFISVVILLALAVGLWQAVDYAIPEDVTVIYETVSKFDKKELKTRSRTVEGVLEESGFEIGEADLIHPIVEKEVKDGMEIRVRHATNATGRIAGKKTKLLIVPGTVEDNLLLNDVEFDDNDIIKPSLNTKITEKTKIVVDKVAIRTATKKETVKARSIVRLDPKLTSGVEERVNGHDGKAIYEYKTIYVNGKKKETKKTVKKWITKVKDHELRLGTSLTGHSGEYEVKESFTGNTTAYWMGNNARGASGGRCVYGTCAVDPRRIPYGTDMWIEGYGYARANDCGSAIKNDHVDLWMHSYRESCQWGRRFVTVYVLR